MRAVFFYSLNLLSVRAKSRTMETQRALRWRQERKRKEWRIETIVSSSRLLSGVVENYCHIEWTRDVTNAYSLNLIFKPQVPFIRCHQLCLSVIGAKFSIL